MFSEEFKDNVVLTLAMISLYIISFIGWGFIGLVYTTLFYIVAKWFFEL